MSTQFDPILRVCGMPSGQLLQRIHSARLGGAAGRRRSAAGHIGRAWRFIDFAALNDLEFVDQAHWRLLGRAPRPEETIRRQRDIANGMTRAEVVLRLVGSKEGRQYGAATGGLILPVMVGTAGTLDRLLPARHGSAAVAAERHRRNANRGLPVRPALTWMLRVVRAVPGIGGLAKRAMNVASRRVARRDARHLPAIEAQPFVEEATPIGARSGTPRRSVDAVRDATGAAS